MYTVIDALHAVYIGHGEQLVDGYAVVLKNSFVLPVCSTSQKNHRQQFTYDGDIRYTERAERKTQPVFQLTTPY